MAGNVDRVTLAIEAPAIRALSHGMREKCGGYFTIEREYSRAGAPLLSLGRVASGLMAMAGSEADADGLKPNPAVPRLHGERVLLREWIQDDLEPFEALNADARVMEHFRRRSLARSQTRWCASECPQFAERGFGVWAVEVPEVAPFIGYVGLFVHTFEAEFTPCVEIGWRRRSRIWVTAMRPRPRGWLSHSASKRRVSTRSSRSLFPPIAALSPSWSASG